MGSGKARVSLLDRTKFKEVLIMLVHDWSLVLLHSTFGNMFSRLRPVKR